MKQLVVFDFHQLGDAALTFPFLRGAREKFEVTVCCRPVQAPVFRWVLPAERVLSWEPDVHPVTGLFRIARTPDALLRAARQADAGVCGWSDARVHVWMRQLGLQERIGLPMTDSNYFTDAASLEPGKLWRGMLLQRLSSFARPPLLTTAVHRRNRSDPHLESWRLLAEALGIVFRDETPWFSLDGSLEKQAGSSFRESLDWFRGQKRPRWLVHPGARLRCRRWPEERFSAILTGWFRNHELSVLVVDPPDFPWEGAVGPDQRVARCATVDELALAVDAADGVLAHDSFASHLGAALGKRVVSLFGEMPACWFAPFRNEDWVVGGRTSPSRRFFRRKLDARRHSLADSITVGDVEAKLAAATSGIGR